MDAVKIKFFKKSTTRGTYHILNDYIGYLNKILRCLVFTYGTQVL